MRQRELLLRRSKDLCAVGQGGWAGCLGPGADCMEEALHNRLLSEPGLAGLAEPRWGQGSMQPPRDGGSVCALLWLSWRRVHSPASWANLKVFQSEQTKKLDPHAMLYISWHVECLPWAGRAAVPSWRTQCWPGPTPWVSGPLAPLLKFNWHMMIVYPLGWALGW